LNVWVGEFLTPFSSNRAETGRVVQKALNFQIAAVTHQRQKNRESWNPRTELTELDRQGDPARDSKEEVMAFRKDFKDPGDTAIPGRRMPPPDTSKGPIPPQPRTPPRIVPQKPTAPLGPDKQKER